MRWRRKLTEHTALLAAAHTALADCLEESEKVLNILNTLMDITEAEAGMMKLQREPVELCQLTREVVELYEYVAEEKKITVRMETLGPAQSSGQAISLSPSDGERVGVMGSFSESRTVTVPVDRTRMRQVLANLLDNAIKYTPSGGYVTISVRNGPGQALVRFRDTGIGIPHEEQDRIWDRLYRGDKSRSQRGLGLGLSLVKAVVEAHGGTVTVSSQPNHGAEFTVHLPSKVAA